MITLQVNDIEISVADGSTVATAIFVSRENGFRRSVTGEIRLPLCGIGVCFECRVTINGIEHQRSCQILAENGMVISVEN